MGVDATAHQPLRILALVEAATVTGPAKNLIEFGRTIRDGNQVEVSIATFARGPEPCAFTDAVRQAGIPLALIPESSAFDRNVLGRIRHLVAELKPDIVQTHAVKSHFLIYLSGLWKTRPWIAFHHGYTTTDLKMRVYNQLDRVSLRKPARLVTVSRAFERQLMGQGIDSSRITVLQNAVDPRWAERVKNTDRAEARRKLGIATGELVLLAVGRLSQEKAHIDLIQAFTLLRKKGRQARLILVGDGPERSKLEQAAGPGVLFTGQVHDTPSYYAATDVLVLPSLTEGSPNVLLEAMAAGVPVVATDVGGIPEIVRHRESALLVSPQRPDLLAQAIEEMLSSPELRRSLIARAQEIIAQNHTPEVRARTLIGLYTDIRAAHGTEENTTAHVVIG
jgi:glycosyltransferase involved in cell wall biosynthesis